MADSATKIDLYLKNPSGSPMTNTRVIIRPTRASFWSGFVGVVEDTEVMYETDLNGYVQMTLWPLPYPYILTYSYSDDAVPGTFLFYVPESTAVINFQDLVVQKADSNDNYIDTVLAQIIEAKVKAILAADRAEAAAAAAAASEASAATSEDNAQASEEGAATSYSAMLTNQGNIQDIYTQLLATITQMQAINLTNKLKLGGYTLWVDSTGRLRIMNGMPVDLDNDGTVVGTQS
jgi:hypothetical protein